MSITSKLAYLEGTKDYIRQCIQQKGVSVPASTTFREYGDKILLIETGSTEPPEVPTPELNLQEKTANPTGTQFDVTPDEDYNGLSKVTVTGEINLKPENIAYGVTIYGVTGTMVPTANMTTVPDAYKQLFEQARQLYTGDYKNLMILESDQAVAFGFMLDGFKVMSYDDSNSEFTAQKWVYVAHNKGTGQWKVEDWSNSTSNGNSYIKNIRYSDAYIYYGTRLLYPFLVNEDDDVIGIPNDVFKIVVNAAGTGTLRLYAAGLFFVDWGDGTSEEYSANDYTTFMTVAHAFPSAGDYTVTFVGYMSALRKYTSTSTITQRIKEILTPFPKGCIQIDGPSSEGTGFFYQNTLLTSIPPDLFSKCSITSCKGMFEECTGLTSIPPDLLVNQLISTVQSMFSGCSNITGIPASLFANGVSLVNVSYCFRGCKKVMNLPSHLFDNCPNINIFTGCFQTMTMLIAVPEGFFKNHYNNIDMSSLFSGCTGLETTPYDLFYNIESMISMYNVLYNTAITSLPNLDGKTITSLEGAFYNTKITSIPEDYLDEVEGLTSIKTMFSSCKSLAHIPEWWNNPALSSITHTNCFNQCTNADNYSEKPSGW